MKTASAPAETFNTVGASSGGSFIIDPKTGKAVPNPADGEAAPTKPVAEEKLQTIAEDPAQKKVK